MKRFLIVLAVFAVACGPNVRDKRDSPNGSANGNPNNVSNNVNGDANGSPNNTTPNNTTPNNTNPNNTNPNNTNPNNTNPNNTNPNNTSPNNTNPNNTNPNNTNPNNTNPNNTNPDNNTTVPPDVVQKCATACELLWGNCVDTRCDLDTTVQNAVDDVRAGCQGTGGDAAELCTARYQSEPDYADLVDDIVADGSCDSEQLVDNRCFLLGTDVCDGCPTPDLGGSCTSDNQCNGGLLAPICLAEEADGSTPGGQCVAGGCQFDPGTDGEGTLLVGGGTGCGADGACYVIDSTSAICLPRCVSNSDCDRGVNGPNQSGYSCSIFGELNNGEVLGICQSACSDAYPCEDGLVCSNTQVCEYSCFSDTDCPQDFTCTGTAGDETYCEYAG